MSRRDQLFQAVNQVQGQVYGFIDSRTGGAGSQQPSSSSAGGPPQAHTSSPQGSGSGVHRSNTTATLPLYSRNTSDPSEAAPPAVLQAPPSHAQAAADMMPRARIAQGNGREARRAAADLREEQLRSGQLKTRHTFVSAGGRIVLDIDTAVPQRTLTYMGGTSERGRGAIRGRVIVHAQPNDRVTAIRLKIKGVVRVMVPKASTPQQPYALERGHPSVEPCVEKELLLLQLESQLYDSASNREHSPTDPTLLTPGKHEYPFSIDVPSQTSKGVDLPPSFVLAPMNKPEQAQRPQATSKLDALISSIPTPHLSTDWASVKWYIKLTVERPGIFRTNERIFAPFVYLPPPPSGLRGLPEHVLRRLRLAGEVDSLLRRFQAASGARPIDLQRLCEPMAQWETIRLAYGAGKKPGKASTAGPSAATSKKPGMFSKMLFGAQVEQKEEVLPGGVSESFAIHIPKKPFVFALRSGVPYVLSRSVEWTGRGTLRSDVLTRLPNVGLYQRANVFARSNKGPVAGTVSRFVAAGRQPPDAQAVWTKDERVGGGGGGKEQINRRTEYWLGVIDLPSSCAPDFETPILTLEYYLGVRSPHAPNLLYTEPIVLVCPPSAPARVPTASMQQLAIQPPSRTGTPSSMDGRRKKTSAEANGNSASGPSRHPSSSIPAAAAMAGKHSSSANAPPAHRPAQAVVAPRPVAPPTTAQAPAPAAAALEEKHAMQARYDEQMRASSAGAGASSSSSAARVPHLLPAVPAAVSQPASQAAPPPPPPRPSDAQMATNVPATAAGHAPGTATPLTMDNDGEGGQSSEPDQWLFHDDELTDLPPSYFEATGQRDQD